MFLFTAVVTNLVYQRDILNGAVDKVMQMTIKAKNKIIEVIDMVLVDVGKMARRDTKEEINETICIKHFTPRDLTLLL